MGCKTKLKAKGEIKSAEAWSDLTYVVGYYMERGERSISSIHEKVKEHFPDVDEGHIAASAKEVLDELYDNSAPTPNRKATLASLRAEVKKLTDPTAIERAEAAIKKLESEDTSKYTPEQWQARRKEIVDEARYINRGSRVDESYYAERESAFMDPEVRKLRMELNAIKKKADRMLARVERQNRSTPEKIANAIGEVISAPRSLKASIDLSAPGRQGILLFFANPLRSKQAFKNQFRALSGRGADAVKLELEEHPRYAEVESDGVLAIDAKEEAFPSDLAERLPGVRHSSDAYSAFLRTQRLDWYDALAKGAERLGRKPLSKSERAALANHVNIATGRGNVKMLSPQGMDVANKLLFSIRLQSSRIQYLVGAPILNKDASPRVKAVIAANYAQTVAGASATVFVLSQLGMKLNTEDKTEHNFLKMTLGDTDYDISGGLSKYIVFASRMSDKGSNPNQKMARLTRFLRNLTSPAAGLAHDAILNNGKFYYRTDLNGNKRLIWDDTNDATRMESAKALARELLLPIGIDNAIDRTERGRPLAETAQNTLTEAVGIGVTNREK